MAPILNYGMICGVGIRPLRKPFFFFPNLYSITCVKDASVVVHLDLSYGSH